MKYRFICAIHYLQLEKEELTIHLPFGNVSNKRSVLEDTFNNNLSLDTIGLHSIDEVKEAFSYHFVDGDYGDAITQKDVDAFGTNFCFALLRQIQYYVGKLWNLRDNCIYVRDGFLYTYSNRIADGCTFKASVSLMNTFATGEYDATIFTEKELVAQAIDLPVFLIDDVYKGTANYKDATQFQHYKGSGLSRKELVAVYVAMARKEAIVPVKILMYCSAIEALVASSTMELSHQVAERVAVLIGQNKDERCQIYSDIKKGYDTRSKIAHGDYLKKNESIIKEDAKKLDSYLRQLLQLEEPFDLKKDDMDMYYLSKIMN